MVLDTVESVTEPAWYTRASGIGFIAVDFDALDARQEQGGSSQR